MREAAQRINRSRKQRPPPVTGTVGLVKSRLLLRIDELPHLGSAEKPSQLRDDPGQSRG